MHKNEIKVFPKTRYNKRLIQMSLVVNNIWHVFNDYMSREQMIDAKERLDSIGVIYTREIIHDKSIIKQEHFNLNNLCKNNNFQANTDFDRMFVRIYWHKNKEQANETETH